MWNESIVLQPIEPKKSENPLWEIIYVNLYSYVHLKVAITI